MRARRLLPNSAHFIAISDSLKFQPTGSATHPIPSPFWPIDAVPLFVCFLAPIDWRRISGTRFDYCRVSQLFFSFLRFRVIETGSTLGTESIDDFADEIDGAAARVSAPIQKNQSIPPKSRPFFNVAHQIREAADIKKSEPNRTHIVIHLFANTPQSIKEPQREKKHNLTVKFQ